MATGGHWTGGSVGTRGDQHFGADWADSHFGGDWTDSHFGQDENDALMEGAPALIVGVEDIEPDCADTLVGCGMPGANPWGDVSIAGDVTFGADTLVNRIRGWWANRKAAKAIAAAQAAGASAGPSRRHPRGNIIQQAAASGDPYALGQSLGAMQDMDSEVEALSYAVQHDPYALGQPL
jgi:hypothetical protein